MFLFCVAFSGREEVLTRWQVVWIQNVLFARHYLGDGIGGERKGDDELVVTPPPEAEREGEVREEGSGYLFFRIR